MKKERGQFNKSYSANCRICKGDMFFEAEPYPGIEIVRLCENCGEINILTFDSNTSKHPERKKIQHKTLPIIEGVARIFRDIDMKMGVRQICYQLSSLGIIEKTEPEFDRVENVLRSMRWRGWVDFSAIVDETRYYMGIRSFKDSREYLDHVSRAYRKSLWDSKDVEVEIFIEKLGLAAIVREITDNYDVKIFPFRGFNSLSAINEIALKIKNGEKYRVMYHFGDHDPSGVCAANKFPETLIEMGVNSKDFHFERIAIHKWQIDEWNLPTRATKQTDTRSKGFSGESCELDAIDPRKLKSLVENCILRHIDRKEVERIKAVEEMERNTLKQLVLH